MTDQKVTDQVKRPDHYICLDCQRKFNDAKFRVSENAGIHSALATCPYCNSSKIKISWWKPKQPSSEE